MVTSSEKSEALIFALETATRAGGVAVARGEKILTSKIGDASISHSNNLLEMIEQVLFEAGVKLTDIDLFAVASGPGSFTGLRIGLATAKAFGAHLHKTLIGVSTLAAVARASLAEGEIVSLLPAGRGEVFVQRFVASEGEVTAADDPKHLGPSAVIERYRDRKRLTFAGEGVSMFAEFGVPSLGGMDQNVGTPAKGETPNSRPKGGTPNLSPQWNVLRETLELAPAIAMLAVRDFREGKSVAPENLRAVYVRASDAEINEQWQRQKGQLQAQG